MVPEMKIEFKSVEEYLAAQPEALRAPLENLRQTIKKAAPEAQETISYSMPAYKFLGMVAYFAPAKKHYGLYIMPYVLEVFKPRLGAYKLSKSTIQFPWNTPLPVQLVTEIIQYAVQFNRDQKATKEAAKRRKS